MNDFVPRPEGKLFENGTLVFERLLPGPIERVWRYVAEGDLRKKWIMAGDMTRTGTATMTFDHTSLSGEVAPDRFAAMRQPVSFDVEVLEVDPPHRLTFTWPEEASTGIVTIELSPIGDKVLLRLTHRHPDFDRAAAFNHMGGWHTHLGLLEDALSSARPRPFWTYFAGVEADYLKAFGDKDFNTVAVSVEKTFKASANTVFAAWLDPALIANFIVGPDVRDERLIHVQTDPVAGGAFSFKVERNGEIIDHIGHYYEVVAPTRLSFSWGIAGVSDPRDSRVSIDIVATSEGCQLTLTHDMAAQWADYAERTQQGWTFMLEKLGEAI
ncbi:SRPBCC domain-containing protein [Asticcacaulis sp. BYS171W]|uniref:SRPBCC domain-containing protein n=1 Tax=Asticcacaulis aquaticus TaxID=2984212 RepID=A0ABT5HUN0_9CAUL|nr:SRPBCC domain-containing protein [Asticcacaulis aquaticus]MDC7683555.1 SRPBCC domain-containing protein [Asticcacaulis aquaticus]